MNSAYAKYPVGTLLIVTSDVTYEAHDDPMRGTMIQVIDCDNARHGTADDELWAIVIEPPSPEYMHWTHSQPLPFSLDEVVVVELPMTQYPRD